MLKLQICQDYDRLQTSNLLYLIISLFFQIIMEPDVPEDVPFSDPNTRNLVAEVSCNVSIIYSRVPLSQTRKGNENLFDVAGL